MGSNLRNHTDNLVAGHHGIDGISPLIPREVNVRVAYPAELDVDKYICRSWRSSLDAPRHERRGFGLDSIGGGWKGH